MTVVEVVDEAVEVVEVVDEADEVVEVVDEAEVVDDSDDAAEVDEAVEVADTDEAVEVVDGDEVVDDSDEAAGDAGDVDEAVDEVDEAGDDAGTPEHEDGYDAQAIMDDTPGVVIEDSISTVQNDATSPLGSVEVPDDSGELLEDAMAGAPSVPPPPQTDHSGCRFLPL